MSLTHYPKPIIKIEVDPTGAEDDIRTSLLNGSITRVENGCDIAYLLLTDEHRTLYNNTIVYGDDVAIYLDYEVNSPLTTTDLRFYGFVEDMQPGMTSQGEVLAVRLRHYSRCFLDMTVSEEYGSDSANPTIDELHEILDDNAVGIIDNYINEINNDGNTSGYSIDDTYIERDTDVIKYIYFPYKAGKNSIDDLLDIYQALQTHSTAGWHWIVKTVESPANTFTNYFCLAQVGDHKAAAPNVASQWPTWWNTDQAGSTIVTKQDMMVESFDHRRAEANYILYYGRLRKPMNDRWCENNNALWGTGDHTVTSDENGVNNFLIKDWSLKATHVVDATPDNRLYYPSTADADWDVESWGGIYNIPTIDFWFKSSATEGVGNSFELRLHTNGLGGDYYMRDLGHIITTANYWYHFIYTIGSNAPQGTIGFNDWAVNNIPDWGDIDAVEFIIPTVGTGQNVSWYIDGLTFSGWVARGAKKKTSGGAAEPYYKQKIITDDVGKDDSGFAADDDYLMAQMAYGELLRASRRPVQGRIILPGKPTMLAGQKAHIHGAQHSGGFRVNKDMRISEVKQLFTPVGFSTVIAVTDDLINGRALPMMSPYNLVLQASKPEFQSRQVSSIKARSIDITQPILEHSYNFNDFY